MNESNHGSNFELGKQAFSNHQYEQAFNYLKKAIDVDGEMEANYFIGCMYDFGSGVEKDSHEAAVWYSAGAEANSHICQYMLGQYYANAEEVELNQAKAYEWFKKASAGGIYDADFKLGLMYENGFAVKQDFKKAFEYYKTASDKGHVEAKSCIGNLYKNGYVGDVDYEKAFEFFLDSANLGSLSAQANLATLYEAGNGVKQDYAEAFYWYKTAGDRGNLGAKFYAAMLQLNGKGIEKNIKSVISMLEDCAKEDSVDAIRMLGLIYTTELPDSEENRKEAFKWYQRGSELGDTNCLINLAMKYVHGFGVEPDLSKACHLYDEASDNGDINAKLELGRILSEDRYNVPKDYDKAFKLFYEAANASNAESQYELGYMYSMGLGVSEDNISAAYWYKKSIENGCISAKPLLANYYFRGIGVAKDYYECERLCLEVEEKSSWTCYYLGCIYAYGLTDNKNVTLGFMYLDKAIDMGLENAVKEKQKIQEELNVENDKFLESSPLQLSSIPLNVNEKVSVMSASSELEKLHELHQKGILTAEEYKSAKAKLLSGNSGNAGSTGGFFAGIAAKRFVNFIIGFTVFLVVAYILFYFFVLIPAEKKAEEEYKAFQEKSEKEFKEFGEKADRDMEAFRKKHGFK